MWLILTEIVGVSIILLKYQIHNLFGGDSAEFVLNSQTWSIAHPPGYPFYSLISNVLHRLLFFFPQYFRLNLLSIIPTIFTVFILYLLILNLTRNKVIASLASFLYAVLFPVWLYSEVPEVFALNNFILVSITYLSVLFNKNPENKYKYTLFFLLGFIFSHHHIAILFIPGWYFLIQKKIKLFIKNVWKSIIFFVFGISFFIYAPVASWFNPPLDYENAKTLIGLLRLVTRSSYGTFKAYAGSSTDLFNQIFNVFSLVIYLLQDFRITGFLIIILGFVYLKIKNKYFFKFIIFTLAFELFFIFYSNFPTTTTFILAIYERFFIPIYLLFVILFAYGLLFIKDSLRLLQIKYFSNLVLANFINKSIYIFSIGYVLIVFSTNLQIIRNLPQIHEFDILAKNILDTVPKNGVLSTSSDSTSFATYHYYFAKKYKSNVILIFMGLLERKYYIDKLKIAYPSLNLKLEKNNAVNSLIEKNDKYFDFYLESPQSTGVWLPYGLLWKHYSSWDLAKQDINKVIKINHHLWQNVYHVPIVTKHTVNILHLKAIREHYVARLINFINLLIQEKKYDDAIVYLNKIDKLYNRNNKQTKALLMKVYVLKKDCIKASPYQNEFEKILDRTQVDDLTTLLYYYYYCDKNNSKVDYYLRIYNLLKNRDQIKLKDI